MSEAVKRTDEIPDGYDEVQFGPKALVVPSEWEVERFGNIFNQRKESIDVDDGETVRYVGLEHINSGELDIDGYDENGLERSSSRGFREGDVLFGKLRPNLEKAAIAPFDGICSSDIIPIYADDGDLQRYLSYLMHSKLVRDRVVSTMEGTNLPRTSWSDLESTLVPVPPRDEQRRIADILSTVDEQIQQTDHIIGKIEALKEGFVQDVLNGDILSNSPENTTKRIGPRQLSLPPQWDIQSIGEICDVKGGKRLPKGHNYADRRTKFPYLRVLDFSDGTIDDSDLNHIDEETREKLSRYTIDSDDVYLSIAGYSLGIAGTVPNHLSGANLTENACKLTNIHGADNEFVAMYLRSDFGQREIDRFVTITGQPKLALYSVKSMKIVLPPVSVQKTAANIRKSFGRKLKQERHTQQHFKELKRGLMQDLFTGKVRVATDD